MAEQLGLHVDFYVVCSECMNRPKTRALATELVKASLPTDVLVDIGREALAAQSGRCFRCAHTIDGDGHVVEVGQ